MSQSVQANSAVYENRTCTFRYQSVLGVCFSTIRQEGGTARSGGLRARLCHAFHVSAHLRQGSSDVV